MHEELDSGLERDSPKTIAQVIDRYLEGIRGTVKEITIEGYDYSLRNLGSTLSFHRSPLLNQVEINEYVTRRLNDGVGRSIIKELSYFKSALTYCGIDAKWSIPKRIHSIPKKEFHVPTPGEVRLLLENLGPESRLSVLLALLAGLRNDEVYRVRAEHYNPTEGILDIPGEIRKTGAGNVIPVCRSLERGILDGASNRDLLVPMSKSAVQCELRNVCGHTGIKVWYGLQPGRRSLVTIAEDAGFSQDSIALVTGHSRRSVTSRYSGSRGRIGLKRNIIESVEERINGKEI